MSNESIQNRLSRLQAKHDAAPKAASVRNSGPFNAGRFLKGLGASVLVCYLFNNIQAISDAAPDAIKNSETPGLLGAPVALLSVAWFAIIPVLFVRHARRLYGPSQVAPSSFVLGAFAGMAIGLFYIKYGS